MCRLPKGYRLILETDLTHCEGCGGALCVKRTNRRSPVGILLGEPDLVVREKQCQGCGAWYIDKRIDQFVPPHGNYAFDVMTEVALSKFQDHSQAEEIQERLELHHDLIVPETTVHHLAHRFLEGYAAVHRAYSPRLTEWFRQNVGGYVLHMDGSCEQGSSVIFIGVAAEQNWVLFATKMATENVNDIKAFLSECIGLFGVPLATVRDLSEKIRIAREAILPSVPDYICEYHLLANIGKRLCKDHRTRLWNLLKKHGFRSHLSNTRQHIISRSKKHPPIDPRVYEDFLRDPSMPIDVHPTALRQMHAINLIRWVEDSGSELNGEYFPFDQPELAFYYRCRHMFDWLGDTLSCCSLKPSVSRMFDNLHRTLGPTRKDHDLVNAAQRLQAAYDSFQELRSVLRLETPDDTSLVRQHLPDQLNMDLALKLEQDLADYRSQLDAAMADENDPARAHDTTIIASQLDTYADQLQSRILHPPDADSPILVPRTNNPPEHTFGYLKNGWRRQSGNMSSIKRLDSANPDELLLLNLSNDLYLDILFDGSVHNIPSRLADHWADSVRSSHIPSPSSSNVSKKLLRSPHFLSSMRLALDAL